MKHVHHGDLMLYVRPNTLDIDCIDAIFNAHIYDRNYRIKHGDTIVDLGAYIGDFTVLARSKGARVIAVEPFEDNYNLLIKNCEVNGLDVDLCCFGISDNHDLQVADFFVNRGNYGACSLTPDTRIENQEVIKIATRTLDDLFDSRYIDHCDLLKFDTEGEELKYFPAFSYYDRVDRIVGECQTEEAYNTLKTLFESKGYKVTSYKLNENSELVIYANR